MRSLPDELALGFALLEIQPPGLVRGLCNAPFHATQGVEREIQREAGGGGDAGDVQGQPAAQLAEHLALGGVNVADDAVGIAGGDGKAQAPGIQAERDEVVLQVGGDGLRQIAPEFAQVAPKALQPGGGGVLAQGKEGKAVAIVTGELPRRGQVGRFAQEKEAGDFQRAGGAAIAFFEPVAIAQQINGPVWRGRPGW